MPQFIGHPHLILKNIYGQRKFESVFFLVLSSVLKYSYLYRTDSSYIHIKLHSIRPKIAIEITVKTVELHSLGSRAIRA